MTSHSPSDISIGKFDILATYTYAHAVLSGMDDDEAKQRGMVAAIMGAQARLGVRREHHEEFQAQKEAAEKKKKTTITAESFDKQVAHKLGEFFDEVFLPAMKKPVDAGLSDDEVKRLVKIPGTWWGRRSPGNSSGSGSPSSSRSRTNRIGASILEDAMLVRCPPRYSDRSGDPTYSVEAADRGA